MAVGDRIGFLQSCGDVCNCLTPIVYEEIDLVKTITLFWGGAYPGDCTKSLEKAQKVLREACLKFGAKNMEEISVKGEYELSEEDVANLIRKEKSNEVLGQWAAAIVSRMVELSLAGDKRDELAQPDRGE